MSAVMQRMLRWFRSPRSLPLVLGLVVALPAAALIVLGVRILEQDRALAAQRRGELAQQAADRAVRILEQQAVLVFQRLDKPQWAPAASASPGSLELLLTPGGLRLEPASSVAWTPAPARLSEPGDEAFRIAEEAEFQSGDLASALALSRRLSAHRDPAIRAGALLRESRVLRKMGRPADAVQALARLAAVPGVGINGVPVELVARQARCTIAADRGDAAMLREESLRLQEDLNAGRWVLDRVTYELVTSRLAQWLGPEARRNVDLEALAAGVEWLVRERRVLPANGARIVRADAPPAIVMWTMTPERTAAVVELAEAAGRRWGALLERVAAPATVTLLSDAPEKGTSGRSSDVVVAVRMAPETGLPWNVIAAVPSDIDLGGLAARTRTVQAGLAAVLILAAAGGYLVIRMRRQEIVLATLQSDFVAAVSHEFRTPLTALTQFNELLEEDEALPAETRRTYHRAQSRATERLRRLVEALLDFGRMEAGRRPYLLQPLDAGAFVRDTIEEFRDGLDGSGVDIRVEVADANLAIEADGEALGRALWNLLDNAVKYAGASGAIRVSVAPVPGQEAPVAPRIAIAVSDSGPGIPLHEQTRVFQEFVRGAAASAAGIKGTGIGLAMAQHVVSAHRGRILLASEPGHGSTFTIELPHA